MIKIDVTQAQIDRAKSRYKFGVLPGSITGGKQNVFGALGEIVVLDYYNKLGKDIQDTPTTDFDFIIDEKKVDVKSRPVNNKPKPFHTFNLPEYSVRLQKCEFYLVVWIRKDLQFAWIYGYIEKDEFVRLARFYKKDEPYNYYNGKPSVYHVDTYQIINRQLKKINHK